MCDFTHGSLCPSPTKYIIVCGYSDLPCFQKLESKVIDPRWPLTPCLLRSHVWLPMDHCSKSRENTSKYVDTVFKNLIQRTLTPRWPLTPCLLRPHVWLYPRIIVSKSHGNTSMYVDTVINFAKLPHTTYYVHTYYITTYYVHNEWSHSLLLNSVQARQKMKMVLCWNFRMIIARKTITRV